jgi:hypothetical protein
MKHGKIIVDLPTFLEVIKPLAVKQDISCYIAYRNLKDKTKVYYTKVNFEEVSFENLLTEEYDMFFFTSKDFEVNASFSFYEDNIFEYCVDGEGGRKTNKELERIRLRIISKTPDKKIEAFMKSLSTALKKDSNFTYGFGNTSSDKTTFYLKSVVRKYKLWDDFSRKIVPIEIQ